MMWYNNYYPTHMWWGSGWGVLGMLMMLLWWALVIAAVVLFARWVWRMSEGERDGRKSSAREILEERYAKGEIDKEEYEQKKKDLA